jgi:YggT family protein
MARIILTWFGGMNFGSGLRFLASLTDPYLNWWRNKLNLRVGVLDLSPLAGIAALSVAQTICTSIARQGSISLGIIVAVIISAGWSIISTIVGFCLVALILRLIAYIMNVNMFSPFWRVVDTIASPLQRNIVRIFFGNKMLPFFTMFLIAAGALTLVLIAGNLLRGFLVMLLINVPL